MFLKSALTCFLALTTIIMSGHSKAPDTTNITNSNPSGIESQAESKENSTDNTEKENSSQNNTQKESNSDSQIMNDNSDTFMAAFSKFVGNYTYDSDPDNLSGVLTIGLDNDGDYTINDTNTNGYRFIASISDVQYIDGDSLFIKYPKEVYYDGTAIFTYYTITKTDNYVCVYEIDSDLSHATFLYVAEQ